MIKKLISVKGVGKYEHFNASDMKIGSLFDRLNVIYANNGSGKTTLSAIFKSLEDGNPNIINDRKTIGFEKDQEISILGDVRYDFKKNRWNNTLDNLEVFDIFFINNNIFSGFEVSSDHKKKLHRFVIGEKGVQLSEDIKLNKETIAKDKNEQKEIELEITKTIKEFKVKDYIRIRPDEKIDQKIDSKSKEIEMAKKQEHIKNTEKPKLVPKIKLPIDIQKCKSIIGTSVEDIDNEYISKVQGHLHNLKLNNMENPDGWIRKGYLSINHEYEKCPFCSQELTEVGHLITSYRQFFNEEYNKIKGNCEVILGEANNYNLQLELEKIRTKLTKNENLLDFWMPLIQNEVAATMSLEENDTDLNELYNQVKLDLHKKLETPHICMRTDNFDLLDKEIKAFNNYIEEFNTMLETINTKVDDLKNSERDLEGLEKELRKLKEIKNRFKNPILTHCHEYIRIEDKTKDLNDKNKKMKKDLDDHSVKIFEKYGEKINDYLKQFSTGYKIKDIKSTIVGRSTEPSVSYILTLNDKEISFENSNGKIQASKALSEGDRSTLALAFFLAKLDIEENMNNKVVVFDDPLSSFDSNRRNKTVNLLIDKSQKLKQTFILSHNDSLVFNIYEKASPTMFTIFNGKLDDLDQDDMDDLMEHRYFTQLKKIEAFCKNPNSQESINEIRGSVRIVLEDSLKFRYRKYLKTQYTDNDGKLVGPMNNKDGLGKMINILEASSCKFKEPREEVIAELRELNEFSNPSHHGSIESAHRDEQITIDELITFLDQTLDVVYEKL